MDILDLVLVNYEHSGTTLSNAIQAESKLQETMSQTQTGKTKLIQLYAIKINNGVLLEDQIHIYKF